MALLLCIAFSLKFPGLWNAKGQQLSFGPAGTPPPAGPSPSRGELNIQIVSVVVEDVLWRLCEKQKGLQTSQSVVKLTENALLGGGCVCLIFGKIHSSGTTTMGHVALVTTYFFLQIRKPLLFSTVICAGFYFHSSFSNPFAHFSVLISSHEFDSEQIPDLTKDIYIQDIHCVGSLCKLYFRELPNPLLTYQLYEKFSVSTRQCLSLSTSAWLHLRRWNREILKRSQQQAESVFHTAFSCLTSA